MPKRLAIIFAAINAPLWPWFLMGSLFRHQTLESGIGITSIAIVLMGVGAAPFFVLAGLYSGLFHAGVVPAMTSTAVFGTTAAICGISGWAGTGFALGRLIETIKNAQSNKRRVAAHRSV